MPLLLALLAGSTAAAQSKMAPSTPGVRHIELAEDGANHSHEVVISPGLTTAFRIHGATIDRDGTLLEGRERMWVSVADEAILLVPSEQVVAGERLRLTVAFKGGTLPASATFTLVVHPALAERQVEIYRQSRSAVSLRAEVKEKDTQLQQCREQLDRLQGGLKQPGGLLGLIATGQTGEKGVTLEDITEALVLQPGDPLRVQTVRSFRSAKQVAVELWLELPAGTASWMAEGLMLRGRGGEELKGLSFWQDVPTTSEMPRRVVVAAQATEKEAHGPFTLKLWDAGGQRTITLGNVTFP
ncbi:DUF2381 family protein [Myxococcus sp. RHSTA-1-4]|uniref:DUF2381 family protein n=1 Tax=Myxococcus sp. RHSTA-1-4 TaxID=2874601 RepID=UPI001CBC2F0D|nr:DUF2381 family protein [Myxococcus sp. RHSTA-1-4]MBZ4421763.1 DUF2381 family protein [Myxococcus sp. RHSTA-1-4]